MAVMKSILLFYRNSFSQLVGEEFLKYFDFTSVALDTALRQFVKHLAMSSELQDRDQLLLHFARRYYECNSDTYKSEGTSALCTVMMQFC